MEHLIYTYPNAKSKIKKKSHVGVVGSGNLEVLFEESEDIATIEIITKFDGNSEIWKAICDTFMEEYSVDAKITINDFGATPGVVKLRLLQGLEVSELEK